MAKTEKQPKPTMSQYSYMVTGLLTAQVQRKGFVNESDIEDAVRFTKKAYDLIGELMTEQDNDNESEATA